MALGEVALVAEDLKRGRLIAPIKYHRRNPENFYLIYSRKIETMPAVKAFCDWILDEARRSESELALTKEVA